MAGTWRERVSRLSQRLNQRGQGAPENIGTAPVEAWHPQPLAINLGIDFGTSFTKICFRDIGTDISKLVTFGAKNIDQAMIQSAVCVGPDGTLGFERDEHTDAGTIVVRQLKMRLAEISPRSPLPPSQDTDLNEDSLVKGLSSWFLASVLIMTQHWFKQHEHRRLKGRTLQWSANVGVPVEHYDSPKIAVFNEVLSVSWDWVTRGTIPSNVKALNAAYQASLERIGDLAPDFHAVPEIAAAVQSFLISREAMPGIYVYFDIGGGTVDGVAFNYVNWDGDRKINFFSGKVAPLGVEMIGRRVTEVDTSAFQRLLLNGKLSSMQRHALKDSALDMQRLVGHVIIIAKKKDPRDWRRGAFQDSSRPCKIIGRLDPSRMIPLTLFLGGGGAESPWYQERILSTYDDFNHASAGIPPYQLSTVPMPGDLDMGGLDADQFGRFAIAYGLSIPFGEGPEVSLPSRYI